MKYRDVVDFEPVETVVHLREADAASKAKRLVETFVISEPMGDRIAELIVPHLQFAKPHDNKGLLVVGNYGTGKSHLMAVLSSIAERAELVDCVKATQAKKALGTIAGRFKVIRTELGGVTGGLRDILRLQLESGLKKLGVSYEFPNDKRAANNKDALQEMMAQFEAKHPDHGLLLVVDEMLDYLRSRKDQEVILDLNFLREMGEFCKSSRFRFLAGLQESLFDSARFQFVADTLKRVKDRFEQVRIAREDVAYVVSERLLRKSPDQQEKIREHLLRFAPLYGALNERMDEFVRLFPVHPVYLETFARVSVAEQREILKTLSAEIRRRLDKEIPDTEPGVVAYDSYWRVLTDNPAFKAVPEISQVIEKSEVLQGRIKHAFPRPQYRQVAERIVDALCVHRLTHDDIDAPMGATPEELRDDLLLHLPTPEADPEFLKTMIEKVLQDVMRTVNGQFLTFNKENGQYYLDLKKDIDFESLIAKKADQLVPNELDRYYFEALARVLECAETPPKVEGYKIWEYELEWRERKSGRLGYLFFGAPNERSTAQPPRDFYLYFLQPHEPPPFKDEKKTDEVFFRLKKKDDVFTGHLRAYAGAREQAATASGANRKIYEGKANDYLRELTTWLREHMASSFEVVYQGRPRGLSDVIHGKVSGGAGQASVRDNVNLAGSLCLAPEFASRSADYPTFSLLITKDNRAQAAQEAVRWLAGGGKTKQGTAVLDALGLLDGDRPRATESKYARQVKALLDGKKHGQGVNRAELVHDELGVEYWMPFRIEPEFLAVTLVALVHSGDLVLSLPGEKIDAAGLEKLAPLSVDDIAAFKLVDRPKELPLAALKELFEVLELPAGLIVNDATREKAVVTLSVEAEKRTTAATTALRSVEQGLEFGGRPILASQEQTSWRKKLEDHKTFLESLQPFNSLGRLKNFPHDARTVRAQGDGITLVRQVEELVQVLARVGPVINYVTLAESVLPDDHPWRAEMRTARDALVAKLANPKERADAGFHRHLDATLADLKSRYQDAYLGFHKKARLGVNDDKKKGQLSKDARLVALRTLTGVEMLPAGQFRQLEDDLFRLKACFALSKKDLDARPTCPYPQCDFRPGDAATRDQSAAEAIKTVDKRLDEILQQWTTTLLGNLEDPTVVDRMELVADAERKALKKFLKDEALPEEISQAFVKALQEVFSSLEKVVIDREALRDALLKGGIPCTTEELEQRFRAHVAALVRGKDKSKVRFVIE